MLQFPSLWDCNIYLVGLYLPRPRMISSITLSERFHWLLFWGKLTHQNLGQNRLYSFGGNLSYTSQNWLRKLLNVLNFEKSHLYKLQLISIISPLLISFFSCRSLGMSAVYMHINCEGADVHSQTMNVCRSQKSTLSVFLSSLFFELTKVWS